MSQLQLICAITNPFGRCNRSGLLRITFLVVGIQVALSIVIWALEVSVTGTTANVFQCAFIWIGFCVGAKRLHDIGCSAWWIPSAMIFMVVWTFLQTLLLMAAFGAHILSPTGPIFWLSIASSMTPVLAAAVWLHFAKGDQQPNKYGPAPDQFGFSDNSLQTISQVANN